MNKSQLIMVVEDSDEHYEAVRRAFQKVGITNPLHRCCDGDEAIEYFVQRKNSDGTKAVTTPAVVLLDLNLPGTDGRGVLAKMKSDADLKKIPVVILTSSANPEDIHICYHEGASSYIIKPIKFDEFLKKIQSLKEYWFGTVELPVEQKA